MTEIITTIGFRKYIFYSNADLTKATSIYVKCTGDQDDFETALEDADIDYDYEMGG